MSTALSFEPSSADAILKTIYYPGRRIEGKLCVDSDCTSVGRISVVLQRTLTLKSNSKTQSNKVILAEQIVHDPRSFELAGLAQELRDTRIEFSVVVPESEAGCDGFAPSLPGWV